MLRDDIDGQGTMVADRTVRIERLLPGSAERVWTWLTDPVKRGRWLAAGAMELHPGGKVEHLFRHQELTSEPVPDRFRDMQSSPVMRGEVTECDPPRLLAYTWPGDGGSSEVTFELFPEGANTLLVLTHRRLADSDTMIMVATGWDAHLGVLVDRLNDAEPRGFWSAFARLEPLYRRRFAEH